MSIFKEPEGNPGLRSLRLVPNNIKALAMDLDGTVLAPGATLSDRTARAVNLCVRRGLRVIITTGRATEAAEPFRSAFGAEGPMVYYNGAVVVEMQGGTDDAMRLGAGSPGKNILHTIFMDKNAAMFCVDIARDMGVYCQMYIPCEGNSSKISLLADCKEKSGKWPEREMYHKHTGIMPELVNLKDVLAKADLQGCAKTMFLAEPEILAKVRPRLEEHFGESAYIAQTHRTFLEVMDPKASKGKGLKFVMEHCFLKKEEVIAFGDEENDIPMFDVCGFSVAPSNAKDSVKAVADIIVGSNAEDGVAIFLEETLGERR